MEGEGGSAKERDREETDRQVYTVTETERRRPTARQREEGWRERGAVL